MRNWMKNAGLVALVGAGFFAIGSGVASADESDNYGSLLSGNQIKAPISIPVNVSGNALSALGGMASGQGPGTSQVIGQATVVKANQPAAEADGQEADEPGKPAKPAKPANARSGMITVNRGSVLSGNQVKAPVSIPVNVCGNAASLSSVSKAACDEGRTVMAPAPAEPEACRTACATEPAPAQACRTACATEPAPAPAAPSSCRSAVQAHMVPRCGSAATPESSMRTLPATNPIMVTSVTIPTRREHLAAQEITTYEKTTNVRQAAGSMIEGGKTFITSPTSTMNH